MSASLLCHGIRAPVRAVDCPYRMTVTCCVVPVWHVRDPLNLCIALYCSSFL
jgi:hypothetical protein